MSTDRESYFIPLSVPSASPTVSLEHAFTPAPSAFIPRRLLAVVSVLIFTFTFTFAPAPTLEPVPGAGATDADAAAAAAVATGAKSVGLKAHSSPQSASLAGASVRTRAAKAERVQYSGWPGRCAPGAAQMGRGRERF